MKTSSLFAILAVGAVAFAAPAFAKTSITKGGQICESAVKAMTPAPKNVRTDSDATKVSDAVLTYTLKVKNADDSQGVVTCKVDRESGAPTITPAS